MGKKIKTLSKRQVLLINTVKGGLVGYFVLHPIVMLVTELMHFHTNNGFIHYHSLSESIPTLREAFGRVMLPWGLTFAVFGALVGLYYGGLIYRLEIHIERIDGFDEYLKRERHLRGGVIRQRTTQLFQLKESNERFQNRIAKYKQKTNDLEKEIKKLKKRS